MIDTMIRETRPWRGGDWFTIDDERQTERRGETGRDGSVWERLTNGHFLELPTHLGHLLEVGTGCGNESGLLSA